MVRRLCWWLPRPRKHKFKGGFPLQFEKMLHKYLGRPDPNLILHPFGGKAEIGLRCDLNPEVKPDFLVDAHDLPQDWTNKFEVVLLDPPYDAEHADRLYNSGKLHPKVYIKEAVRVGRHGGFVVHYHWHLPPRPEGCSWFAVIALLTRVYHKARIVAIFQKEGEHVPLPSQFV